MPTYSITEFKARLSQILRDLGENGGEVIITRRGKPCAKLVAIRDQTEAQSS